MQSSNHIVVDRDISTAIETLRGGWFGDRISLGARMPARVQMGAGAHTTSSRMSARVASQGLSSRGVSVTTHLLLTPRLKTESSYTSTPLLDRHGLS